MMFRNYAEGFIEVVCGCMFAGKTEELIRRITVLSFAKKEIVVFKPRIDNRYDKDNIVSHSGSQTRSIVVDKAEEILEHLDENVEVVAIDEVQFFDDKLVNICNLLADQGKRVMLAGLDKDFRGEPFGIMPQLLVHAEFVTKLSAVCTVCGQPATRTQRLIDGKPASYNDPTILVGASESYEPRCRHCHSVKDAPKV